MGSFVCFGTVRRPNDATCPASEPHRPSDRSVTEDLKPEDIDELVEGLREMEVNVDADNGDKVGVYGA
jgi:hypothetical protein